MAPLLALALAGGVIASDAMQYHASNLAPTARYRELASIDQRFAGRGPTLFTDFDEYSLYVLRDLDVGGPDFIAPPPAFTGAGALYRYPVELDRLSPSALRGYPLIVSRRDPASSRPPSAYRLLWRGSYYEVWGRRRGAPAAVADFALAGSPEAQCARIARAAAIARLSGASLLAARSPDVVHIALTGAVRPARWGRLRQGFLMSTPGTLSAAFSVPRAGVWDVWLQGEIMPVVHVGVDEHPLASVAGQLDGDSVVLNDIGPLPVSLSAGAHRLSISRGGFRLAPGDGGAAALYSAFLAPAGAPVTQPLDAATTARWRGLCRRSHQWVEVTRS